MALHFSTHEFDNRKTKLIAALEARGLDGLLMFEQESMFWLTGYDTFGFCFFQCLYLSTDGTLALLTRSADLRQAQHTSILTDIRVWKDGAVAAPADDLKAMLVDLGASGKRLGVEYASYGLTAANGKAVEAALDGTVTLEDGSGVVAKLRAVKGPAELAYVRKAGKLADHAWDRAVELAAPGVDEGAILAAMQGAIFDGGGDYPGNEFIIGSGEDALLCRYKAGRRALAKDDQLTLEWAGAFRHYHAAMMRTIPIGQRTRRQLAYFEAAREALLACEEELRPGRTAGDVFQAHARVLDAHGLSSHRLNACGYSLGAKFTPSWMDPPMFYEANPWELQAGMVMFIHMIIMDSDSGTAMTLGRTSIVADDGPEAVSAAPLDLVVK
ncbi:MAG: Xaa-Pro peptidase family protein [Pseudomonadota bacterium]